MKSKSIILILIIGLIANGCEYEEHLVTSDEVIYSILHAPKDVVADGVSRTTIEVNLPPGTEDNKRTVSFKLSNGVFSDNNESSISVEATDTLIGNQMLKVAFVTLNGYQEEGPVKVIVQVQNFVREYIVNFIRAYPESILLSTDKLYFKSSPDNEVNITTQIKRKKGTPTSGHPIYLAVTDSTGKEVGKFRNKNTQSDTSGKSINYFSFIDTSYQGSLKVRASSTDADGNIIADSLELFVTKP